MQLKNNRLFQGELLRFSAFNPSDSEQLAKFDEDAEYLRRLDTDYAFPKPIEAFNRFNDRGSNEVEFMLRPIDNDRLIGFVALHSIEWNNQACLLAIGIGDPAYRGKGYGTEALNMILRYGFHELNLNRIGLDVIEYNESAIAMYKKAGFKGEGRMRSAVLRDGNSYDRIIMGILKNEWLEKRSLNRNGVGSDNK
jgi:RimJ/RimL family protein N-acetyltransferase